MLNCFPDAALICPIAPAVALVGATAVVGAVPGIDWVSQKSFNRPAIAVSPDELKVTI